MKKWLVLFLSFYWNVSFSQWHQLTNPATPVGWYQGSAMARVFPRDIWPVANGKIYFTGHRYYSPSSGSDTYLYESLTDFSGYTHRATNSLPSNDKTRFYNFYSFDDSTFCFLVSGYMAPIAVFTHNNLNTDKSFQLPSNASYPLATAVTKKYFYLTTGYYTTNQDTLRLIRSDTGLVKNTFTLANYSCKNTPQTSILFLNDSVGFLSSFRLNSQTSVLLKTTNFGQTWNEVFVDSLNPIIRFSFPSSNTGYLATTNGTIFKTVNSGLNWTQTASPSTSLTCIKFSNDSLGYVGGYSGQLWKTTNGGANWLSEVSTTTNNINALYTFGSVAYFIDSYKKTFKNSADVVSLNETADESTGFDVYPNPASDKIFVSFALSEAPKNIRLYNTLGVLVKQLETSDSSNPYLITLNDVKPGCYILMAETQGKSLIKKVTVIK